MGQFFGTREAYESADSGPYDFAAIGIDTALLSTAIATAMGTAER
ncbi:hypothetical protein [Streptomyces bathyalis]|nr:hypothetical protein [Streptomyces bathyalis]